MHAHLNCRHVELYTALCVADEECQRANTQPHQRHFSTPQKPTRKVAAHRNNRQRVMLRQPANGLPFTAPHPSKLNRLTVQASQHTNLEHWLRNNVLASRPQTPPTYSNHQAYEATNKVAGGLGLPGDPQDTCVQSTLFPEAGTKCRSLSLDKK